MSVHTLAEAKGRLPELLDRALAGEGVVITRDGQPVVELRPIPALPRPVTVAEVEWIAAHRIGRVGTRRDAVEAVRAMRDEDWG